ncbi:uncharacterized protein LOC121387180 [Gigantopelta aegis]|uniref:uncharacterized protein LOC121387180 n=1 Tax=Gigantopelta aegis TaxID=1735272 RepID=UPI001B887F28|nr:uncharacterized protein LOC121387180 [Gigantopelta aegis]
MLYGVLPWLVKMLSSILNMAVAPCVPCNLKDTYAINVTLALSLKVFRAIDDLLPRRASVLEFVADFETGMWKGLHEVYPGLQIKGCCFHWNQAVWRKVQGLGLAQQHIIGDGTCKFIKKVFAIRFLPSEHAEAAFDGLRRGTQVQGLVTLMDYVDRTWMRSSVWSVNAWSVFNQSVRTNNDVEG